MHFNKFTKISETQRNTLCDMIISLQIACMRYEINPSVVEEFIADPNCNTTAEESASIIKQYK